MTSYQPGETVTQRAFLYDDENNLIDPDTIVITIRDINYTDVITEVTMILEIGPEYPRGRWKYKYTLANDAFIGLWKVIVNATYDGDSVVKNDSFRVIP